MKKRNKIILSILVTICLTGVLFVKQESIVEKVISLSIQLLKPAEDFKQQDMVAAPDYSKAKYWATLPERNDESDIVPTGINKSINNGTAPVDVFYIHGTGFTNGNSWTSPIKAESATADNARFSLANEASMFNGCCNIYAPHYREATLFVYAAVDAKERDRILDAVYLDVAKAFEYFLLNLNNNKPFIIVSHSQGTHHALKLVKNVIDATPLADKMVAAYMIGGVIKPVSYEYLNTLKTISACKEAKETACIIHWDTYGVGGTDILFKSNETALCTNPLTWTVDEQLANRHLHLGAAPISGSYTMRFYGDDNSEQVSFKSPGVLMPAYTQAQCLNGALYVDDMSATKYNDLGSAKDHNLHGVNFPLFHMNIRQNVQQRIEQFFKMNPEQRGN